MIRVYDTNALWRHDEILRIRNLEAEIAALGRLAEGSRLSPNNNPALSAETASNFQQI